MFSKVGFLWKTTAPRSQCHPLISQVSKYFSSATTPTSVSVSRRFPTLVDAAAALTLPRRIIAYKGSPGGISSFLKRTILRPRSSSYRRFHSQSTRGRGLFWGTSAFSLGLLGFFETKELSPEDELLMKIKKAVLAIQELEFPKAERHLADAWKMSHELGREDVKTQIMDIQADIAFKKGELDKAFRLFQLVTQRLIYHQGVKEDDNSIVEISLKLAQIYAIKGKGDESLTGFEYCADTQRKKIKQGNNDEDTLMLAAWSLQSLAQLYMASCAESDVVDKVAISKASQYMNEAYKYAVEAVGPEAHQAITIRSDLASISAMEGNVDAALLQLEECNKIAAEKHQFLQAAIRVNTGSLYLQKGEYSEAEKICREARMIAGMYRDQESAIRADECILKSDIMNRDSKKNANANGKNGLEVNVVPSREEIPTSTSSSV